MKKWYCPNCKVYKRVCKKCEGYTGHSNTYHCRCCGTELINVHKVRDKIIDEAVRKEAEEIGYTEAHIGFTW